ncbi:hypothetical protein HQ584_01810 [Patescibacteria group bacterium]|nr:hypothetical protein [Patescibacteria group bacterium]
MTVSGSKQGVLRIIEKLGGASETAISSQMGVSLSYVENLCTSLMKSSFLVRTAGGYELTPEGKGVLRPYRTGGIIGVGRRAVATYPNLPPPG